MGTKNPNDENVIESLKSTLENFKNPIKSRFLKSLGFAHHDVRIFTDNDLPVYVEKLQVENEHGYYMPIPGAGIINPYNIKIVCCSNTTPSILYVHLFVDWIGRAEPVFSVGHVLETKESGERGCSWCVDYLNMKVGKQDLNNLGEYRIPSVGAGKVLDVSFQERFTISCRNAKLWAHETGIGVQDAHKLVRDMDESNENRRGVIYKETNKLFENIVDHVNISLLIILDNEEALPFRWDNEGKKYIQGFNTLGLTVK